MIVDLLNSVSHVCFAPDDGGDGAGGGDAGDNGQGDGADNGGDNGDNGDNSGGDNGGQAPTGDSLLDGVADTLELSLDMTEKPEGLADDYWDSENNKLNVQKLFDDKQSADERAKGLRDKLAKGSPKAPDNATDYTLDLSDDLSDLVPDDDPMIAKAQEIAHGLGMSQEVYQEFMGKMIGQMAEQAQELAENPPELTDEQKAEIQKAEYAKIGANAPAVIRAVETFGKELLAKGLFSEADVEAYKSMAVTGDQVRVLNKFRAAMGGSDIPMDLTDDGLPSDEEIYQQMEKANESGDVKALADVDELLNKRIQAGRPQTLQISA